MLSRLAAMVMLLAAIAVGLAQLGYRVVAPFPYRSLVTGQARAHGLDPDWVAAVIRVESGFRPAAVSRRGAVGLMQLLPSTARWIAVQPGVGLSLPPAAVAARLTDPAVNVQLGSWYLAYLWQRFHGSRFLATAAYNAGPQTVTGWLAEGRLHLTASDPNRIPFPETRRFVRTVMLYAVVYRLLYG